MVKLRNGKRLVLRQLASYSTRAGQEKGARDVGVLNAWLSRIG